MHVWTILTLFLPKRTIGKFWGQVAKTAVRTWDTIVREFNVPPTIKCNSDSSFTAGYFKDYVTVTLGKPGWVDDKRGVKITQVSGPKSGSKFYEGIHTITYKATDTEGATDYCAKTVTIKVIKCRSLATPSHGSKNCDNSDNIYGTDCYFSCSTGYKLIGSSKSSCQKSGYYDNLTPTCRRIYCNRLPTPSHGSKNCDSSQNVYGTECTFRCDPGFQLSGYTKSVCQSDGTFSHSAPSCSRVSCPSLKIPSNGASFECSNANYYGSTCSLKCQKGFTPALQTHTTCQTSKRWSTTDFACRGIQCNTLQTPRDGNKVCDNKDDVYGTECVFSCDSGFELEGYLKSVCLHNGSYSLPAPTCNIVSCPKLEVPSHGLYFKCSNGRYYGSVCTLECETGYSAVRGTHVICQANREWTKTSYKCEDTEKPAFINCPNTTVKSFSTTVRWPDIRAKDNSGSVSVNLTIGQPSGSNFTVGYHVIKYDAEDLSGNKAYPCVFTVKVEALFCSNPSDAFANDSLLEFVDCGSDQDRFVENTVCHLECRTGTLLGAKYVRCDRNSSRVGTATWVFASSEKPFCMQAISKSIGVILLSHIPAKHLERRCPALASPAHGSLSCKHLSYQTVCKLQCCSGYDVARRSQDTYTCRENSKSWSPSDAVPSCRELEIPARYRLTSEFYFHCSRFDEQSTKMKIENNFFIAMKKSALRWDVCGEAECKVDNVVIKYDEAADQRNSTPTRDRRASSDVFVEMTTLPAGRIHRSLSRFTESSQNTVTKHPAASELNETFYSWSGEQDESGPEENEANITTVPSESENFTSEAYSRSESEDSERKDGGTGLRNILVTLRFGLVMLAKKTKFETADELLTDIVEETSKSLQRSSDGFPLNDSKIFDLTVECPPGLTNAKNNKGKCVTCGEGTFYDEDVRSCVACPRNTYQDELGKSFCVQCPRGKATLGNGTKSLDGCMNACPPHQYSLTGLKPCSPCPPGSIQPQEGSTYCQKCPLGTVVNAETNELVCTSRTWCDDIKGGCDHICSEKPGSGVCTCKENYTLQEDGVTCSKDS